MDTLTFSNLKAEFQKSDVEKMIDLYVTTEGLTVEQYKELLRLYPQNEIGRLEKALQ